MPTSTLFTFVLLACAICAVWVKPVNTGRVAVPPWLALFVAATVAGLLAGVLHGPAVVALAAFAGIAYVAVHGRRPAGRIIAAVLAAILALALATHRLPGFSNPILINAVTLSAGAAAFTQYANFDKGAAGLVLLALFCSRVHSWRELGGVLQKTWPAMLITLVAVLGIAVGLGIVRPDVKLSPITLQFVAVNLFFTVVAEEAFFRGFLQARLAASLARFGWGKWLALLCSALLFGLVHLGGGPLYAILAFIAGLGYAYVYQATQRIEAPIILHIALNAVHFIGFTYPFLRNSS